MQNRIELYEDGIGAVEYIQHYGSDLMAVNAARVSFGAHKEVLDSSDEKLIKYLVKHKHTSPFEHSGVTFRFTVPLFVRSQHHRHRTWQFNEVSRRYTAENFQFYEPKKFRTQHKSNRQASNEDELINPDIYTYRDPSHNVTAVGAVKAHHFRSLQLYRELVNTGVCREQARGVLPQNMYTEYYGTTNLNNLLKFVELRTHDGAQWEIQKVANACLDIANLYFPISITAFRSNDCKG